MGWVEVAAGIVAMSARPAYSSNDWPGLRTAVIVPIDRPASNGCGPGCPP